MKIVLYTLELRLRGHLCGTSGRVFFKLLAPDPPQGDRLRAVAFLVKEEYEKNLVR